MNSNETDIAIVSNPNPQQIASIAMQASATNRQVNVSSFDVTSDRGRIMLVKATLMDCKPLKDLVNLDINITDYYIHPASSEETNGEIEEFNRVVVFDDKGEAYQCAARGVIKSLAVLTYARGSLPFDPPIKCTVKLKDIGGAKQWLTLIPDLHSLSPEVKRPPTKAAKG